MPKAILYLLKGNYRMNHFAEAGDLDLLPISGTKRICTEGASGHASKMRKQPWKAVPYEIHMVVSQSRGTPI